MIDITAVRADTPAAADVVHLNNAGSSLPPTPVTEAVVDYLRAEARLGGYEAHEALLDRLDDFYAATATMLGCTVHELAFQSGASEAWWRAFTSVELQPGDRVLAGASEFQANAFGLLQARDRGVDVEVVPNDAAGEIDLDRFDQLVDDRVRLVCLTMVSMSNGAVQPAAEIGQRCREASVPFLLDACQAAGQLPLRVDELACDFLVYTGRKFMRGPRGTGVLYVNDRVRDRLGPIGYVDGRSAEWCDDGTWRPLPGGVGFEFGEQNYAGKAGLAVATRYALEIGLPDIATRVSELATRLRAELASIDGVAVHDEGRHRCGIVTFTHERHDPATIWRHLGDHGVNLSAPGRRNAQWDLGTRGIEAVVRAGVHYFNTDDEIGRLVELVNALD